MSEWLMKWSRDGEVRPLLTVEAADRAGALDAWNNLPGCRADDVLLSATNDWQVIETARQTGELPPAATDAEDRKRMLGDALELAGSLSLETARASGWSATIETRHDTFASYTATAPDGAEYTVTVVLTKPAPKPLPTEPGAMVTWTRDSATRIVQLNNSGIWVMLTRGSVFLDATPAALLDHLTTNNIEWHELVVLE